MSVRKRHDAPLQCAGPAAARGAGVPQSIGSDARVPGLYKYVTYEHDVPTQSRRPAPMHSSTAPLYTARKLRDMNVEGHP